MVFLADFAYWVYFVATLLIVWGPISDNYTGAAWILFDGNHCLHLALAFIVIIAFLINHKKTILIATPLYVAQIFASKFWPINPNSPKFQDLLKEAQRAVESRAVEVSSSTVNVTIYPNAAIYAFYLLSIIYIFFIMSRLALKK